MCRAVCLLLKLVGLQQDSLTWGGASWLMPLPGPHSFLEGEEVDPVFMLTNLGYWGGSLPMIPLVARQGDLQQGNPFFPFIC